jgi:hypothetical protein
MGFVVSGNTVVGTVHPYDRHATVRTDQPSFDDRMVKVGNEVLASIEQDSDGDSDIEYRIGLLKTVSDNNPDMVCDFRFPL